MRPEVPDSTRPGPGAEHVRPPREPGPPDPIEPEGGFVRQGVPAPSREPASRLGRKAAHRAHRRGTALWLALTLGLTGLAAGVVGTVTQILPRTFSPAQSERISSWTIARRWRTWPAGRIFPATIPYRLAHSVFGGDVSLTLTAQRIGIAPQAGCAVATGPGLARLLARQGCRAVLRATYADSTGTLAVTVGVAVLPAAAAAQAAATALRGGGGVPPVLRAVPFPQTVVARFGDAERQLTWYKPAGPYLVLATAGYADGRRGGVREVPDTYAQREMSSAAKGIGGWIAAHIGATPPPPRCPGGPAC